MRRPTLNYLRTESGAGLVLIAAAALAVVIANSSHGPRYFALTAMQIPVRLGAFAETLSLTGWVKTALMPIFFLVIGMQIKFELLRGELSNPRRVALPAVAALGGLIAPAALYLALIHGPTGVLRGWSVGEATDVSVALAVLAVAGPRLPPSLRILLMGVAIVDDLADVGLTAVLHTAPLRPGMLAGAGVVVAALAFLSRWRRAPFLFYAVGFALTWGFVLKSGLSTALAGIACAFTVPIGAHRPGQDSMLKYFMDSLHPYVAYAILPLFAFTSAGFSLRDIAPGDLIGAPPMGVILALWIGKPLGVFGLAWAASALKLVRRPSGADWVEVLGAAMLCGVGFTVSLFLVALTSPVGTDRDEAGLRLAVAAGSALSGLSGAALLSWAQRRRSERGEDVLD